MQVPKDIRNGLQKNPTEINILFRLANFYEVCGRYSDAVKTYKRILDISPQETQAVSDILRLLNHIARQDAERIITDIAEKGCKDLRILNQYAQILYSRGEPDRAIDILKSNIFYQPQNSETYTILGNLMSDIGCIDAAIACYKTAIYYNNLDCIAFNNLAIAFKDNHEIESAKENFIKALDLCPHEPYIHWNYALTLLLSGDYERGFEEYECRWSKPDYSIYQRAYDCDKWDGSFEPKSIIIYAEQGFGDAIQFSRYAEILASKGLNVIIHCHKEIARLMKTVKGVSASYDFEEIPPAIDCYYPMMSLPYILQTRTDNIPSNIPYIKVDEIDLKRWAEILKPYKKRLNIGIAWAGSQNHPNDKRRSIPFKHLLKLFGIKDVAFFSLQIDKQFDLPPDILDLTDLIMDFYDTACLIGNLDLIISADTAVCHLAGAMGITVWILLPFSPDWRWFLDVKTSPWYPTARLFRQRIRDDWSGIIDEVKMEIEKALCNVG
ncbi:MAG: tetratricopeptide repeat-containing glycosyltransferase family protein [Thermodesulfovibrionales bacterium]|nr:tetratricopeptide repeat-containing glycosyltransferase family protein [Thermodesulfovibrionales bacterium]